MPAPKPRFVIGDAVKLSIYGVNGSLQGRVVNVRGTVKAEVTQDDPVWKGAVLSRADAKIRRAT